MELLRHFGFYRDSKFSNFFDEVWKIIFKLKLASDNHDESLVLWGSLVFALEEEG